MRNYDENDDPIREVGGRGFFSKIKSFENDLEYKFQKEMEEFEKYIDEEKKRETNNFNNSSYSNNNYSNNNFNYDNTYATSRITSNTLSKMFGIYFIFIIGFFFLFMFSILGGESPAQLVRESTTYDNQIELTTEEAYEDINISKLEYITFDDGTQIPTLYRFDKETEAYDCDFSEVDPRYKNIADTLEIKYVSIPTRSLDLLEQSLIRRGYEYIGDSNSGRIYVFSKEDGCCLFVETSNTRIIYGCANCSYKYIFDNITYNY